MTPWTFAVEGVTSISVDLHKYGYTPKGASLLLHRTPQLRRSQYFASARWPGYTMLNSTLQSTKSGGPLAAAWAVVQTIGDDGYADLSARTFDGCRPPGRRDRERSTGWGSPYAPTPRWSRCETDGSCDVFTIADEMAASGWYVQPQMSFAGRPPTLHLTLCAATAPRVAGVPRPAGGRRWRWLARPGPMQVDHGIVEFLGGLDPATLTDEDFDGLLAAAGLAGGEGPMELPDRMAEVNALLDAASPELREAVLVAFLDRLYRPVRRAASRPSWLPGDAAGPDRSRSRVPEVSARDAISVA